jgi:hypothetical protein
MSSGGVTELLSSDDEVPSVKAQSAQRPPPRAAAVAVVAAASQHEIEDLTSPVASPVHQGYAHDSSPVAVAVEAPKATVAATGKSKGKSKAKTKAKPRADSSDDEELQRMLAFDVLGSSSSQASATMSQTAINRSKPAAAAAAAAPSQKAAAASAAPMSAGARAGAAAAARAAAAAAAGSSAATSSSSSSSGYSINTEAHSSSPRKQPRPRSLSPDTPSPRSVKASAAAGAAAASQESVSAEIDLCMSSDDDVYSSSAKASPQRSAAAKTKSSPSSAAAAAADAAVFAMTFDSDFSPVASPVNNYSQSSNRSAEGSNSSSKKRSRSADSSNSDSSDDEFNNFCLSQSSNSSNRKSSSSSSSIAKKRKASTTGTTSTGTAGSSAKPKAAKKAAAAAAAAAADGAVVPRKKGARLTPEEREERDAAKAAEKQRKADERAAKKAAKLAEKALEKEAKSQAKLHKAVATGKHVCDEIACVVDDAWLSSLHPDEAEALMTGARFQGDAKEMYKVFSSRGAIRGGIWWTRRGLLQGGSAATGEGVTILNEIMLVVVDPAQFCNRLSVRGPPPNSYPSVGEYVNEALARCAGRRLLLVMQGVAQEVNKRVAARHRASASHHDRCATVVSGTEELEDCCAWLLICKGVECKVTRDVGETGQYLWDLTRSLANNPYRDAVTELHCLTKLKCTVDGGSMEGAQHDDAATGYKRTAATTIDVWMRQLMMIPGVSEPKARCIVKHYPSLRQLLHAFTDPREQHPEELLAGILGARREGVLSNRVYTFFTTDNPDLILR